MPDNPFETRAAEYDAWYDRFPNTFAAEVAALRAVSPSLDDAVEIGVGTGRFAAALGVPRGVEPASGMATLAQARGIAVVRGSAEALPLPTGSVRTVLFITTLCFVRDVGQALREARRVLRPEGHCVIAWLPSDSPLGEVIRAAGDDDPFFHHAALRSRQAVIHAVAASGFAIEQTMQTLLGHPADFERAAQNPLPGHDRGSFVALRARCASGPGANAT